MFTNFGSISIQVAYSNVSNSRSSTVDRRRSTRAFKSNFSDEYLIFFSKSNSFVQDHLINHRFDQQTFQLNLSNIADDEGNLWISYLPEKTQRFFIPTELSSLGIFPQFNKQAFIRDVVEILNKHLYMVKIKFLINSFEFLLSLF